MADLFGNPDALETQPAPAVAVDLFAAAAEAIAFEGGRNVAQVKVELTQPTPEALPADGLFVVGSTTWGFDDAGRYRVQRKEGEAKVRRA